MIEHYYSSRSTTFSSLLFSALRVGSNVVISFSPSIREASCVVSGAPSSKLPDWNNRKETGEKKIIIKIEWGLQQWNRWAYSFKASVSGCCVCERLWILSSTKVRDITRSSRSPQERVTHRLSVINTDVFFFLPISSFDQLAPRWLVAISTPMCLSLSSGARSFSRSYERGVITHWPCPAIDTTRTREEGSPFLVSHLNGGSLSFSYEHFFHFFLSVSCYFFFAFIQSNYYFWRHISIATSTWLVEMGKNQMSLIERTDWENSSNSSKGIEMKTPKQSSLIFHFDDCPRALHSTFQRCNPVEQV